jgi:hypothetical protein
MKAHGRAADQDMGIAPADPRPAELLMYLGYVLGGLGFALGSSRLGDGGAEAIEPVALFSVGALGVAAFIRHSIFHRSDAARMRWDIGRTDNFQIEVGLANLAWGLVALAAVIWDWGVAALAAVTGVFGLYLFEAGILLVLTALRGPADESRGVGPGIVTGAMGALLVFFALAALVDASIEPF